MNTLHWRAAQNALSIASKFIPKISLKYRVPSLKIFRLAERSLLQTYNFNQIRSSMHKSRDLHLSSELPKKRVKLDHETKKRDNRMEDSSDDEEFERSLNSVQHPLAQISLVQSTLHSNTLKNSTDGELSSPKGKRADGSSSAQLDMNANLKQWNKVHKGILENGFKYVVIPNKMPPGRVEAHLEVHVGSLDEEDNEQGIAHYLEHCVFLCTEKYKTPDAMRLQLGKWGMDFGGDSNAYTDFRSTVYTFRVPLSDIESEKSSDLMKVLDVLNELAFNAKLPSEYVNSERGAVLSELNKMNTPEYRVEFQKYQQTHGNSLLAKRFPIGKEELLKKFTASDLQRFYKKHYRIDNMTLYVVGSVDPQSAIQVIKDIFEKNKVPSTPIEKSKEALPPFNITPLHTIKVYQHELIPDFSLNLQVIFPLKPITTLQDLYKDMLYSIIGQTLDTRIYHIEQTMPNVPFTSIQWDFYDSFREHSTISNFVVSSHLTEWQAALQLAVKELYRLYKFGCTEEELRASLGALLKDSHSEAEQNETRDSNDVIEEIIDDTNIGATIMDRKLEFSYQMKVAPYISLKDVNDAIKENFSWIESLIDGKLIDDIEPFNPDSLNGQNTAVTSNASIQFNSTNPDLATFSIFANGPLFAKGKKPKKTKTKDIISNSNATIIRPKEIFNLIQQALKDVEAPMENELPDTLIEESVIQQKIEQFKPHYVKPITKNVNIDEKTVKYTDPETGVVLLRLSNGTVIQLKKTDFEAKQCFMRITAKGGRAYEPSGESGSMWVGLRSLIDGGAGKFSSYELSKYCNFHGISMDIGVTMENVRVDFAFSVSHDGLRKAFELLHLFLTEPRFDEKAFERSKKIHIIDCDRQEKDIDSISFNNMMKELVDPLDPRLTYPTREDYNKLTRDIVKKAVMNHFSPNNLEICIVGDFDLSKAEEYLPKYLGTIPNYSEPKKPSTKDPLFHLSFIQSPKQITARIVDDEQRVNTYMAFPCINRWGILEKDKKIRDPDVPKRNHILFPSRALHILSRLISNKLFSIVREKKSMTYDIGADAIFYSYFDGGFFYMNVVPFYDQIEQTTQETLAVLEQIKRKELTEDDLIEVIVPWVRNINTSMNTNAYWLSLITQLQDPDIPKDLSCIKQIAQAYEAINMDDLKFVIDNYLHPTNMCISTAIAAPSENVES